MAGTGAKLQYKLNGTSQSWNTLPENAAFACINYLCLKSKRLLTWPKEVKY